MISSLLFYHIRIIVPALVLTSSVILFITILKRNGLSESSCLNLVDIDISPVNLLLTCICVLAPDFNIIAILMISSETSAFFIILVISLNRIRSNALIRSTKHIYAGLSYSMAFSTNHMMKMDPFFLNPCCSLHISINSIIIIKLSILVNNFMAASNSVTLL